RDGHVTGVQTCALPISEPSRQEVRRAALAGLIGTALEQYDFVIYGTASALVFSHLFFPNISATAGLLASFSAYAVGFCARPLGEIGRASCRERAYGAGV